MSFDLAVVGAGISGLTLAGRAAREGWRVLLLDASPRVGGALNTHRGDDGFWLELGAHTLFNSYGTLLGALDAVSLSERRLLRRRLPYRLFAGATPVSVFSALHYLDLARGILRARSLRRAGHTAGEFFSALAGARNYSDLIGPALDAVICQSAREVPAEVLFQRKPRRADMPRSFTLPGGLMTLAEALASASGVETVTSARVERIERAGEVFCLRSDGRSWQAARIALAVPPPEAARLLVPLQPLLSEILREIGVVNVESMGVIVSIADTSFPHVAGLIGRDQPFFSMVSRDVIPHATRRGFTFHFRPGVLDEQGKAAVAARVLGTEKLQQTVFATHRLPALRPGYERTDARIDALLAGMPIALTGNYFGALSMEACATRSAVELARLQRGG